MKPHPSDNAPPPVEPRWPAVLAVLAVGGLYLSLPEDISIGPVWLPLAIIAVLSAFATLAHRSGQHSINIILGHLLSATITLFMVCSIALLIRALIAHAEAPGPLLRAGAALWVTNILVFASWYWRLDAGGPHARSKRAAHAEGAFLFPQMTLRDARPWSPQFIDYLFLAFTTSTAFSPTDTPILSRWAKALVMIQACISLLVIAVLVGRAVNIL